MDELPIPARDDPSEVFKQVAGAYDAPAYLRRAQRVRGVYEVLLEQCRRQREEGLTLVKTRLATLFALAGSEAALRSLLPNDEHWRQLVALHAELQPRLRVPIGATRSDRALRGALRELIESLERFNRRWRGFLAALDLSEVNRERDGYNRYFVLEKECAVRSAKIARHGFVPLPLLTHADLFAAFPELPVPTAAG